MKEHPTLFSGPMVRAILEWRKTQTRRVIKPQPCFHLIKNAAGNWRYMDKEVIDPNREDQWKCPYGAPGRIVDHPKEAGWYDVQWEKDDEWVRIWNFELGECWGWDAGDDYESYNMDAPPYAFKTPGDRLWVRENFRGRGNYDDEKPSDFRVGMMDDIEYEATMQSDLHFGKLRPSIFMPRWASRILLEVVSVRVERVQDISEEDCQAEGLKLLQGGIKSEFAVLWNSINLERGYGWTVNPWVWAVEFKILEGK